MIRLFNHYIRLRSVLQMAFDGLFLLCLVMGIALSQHDSSAEAIRQALAQGVWLAIAVIVPVAMLGWYRSDGAQPAPLFKRLPIYLMALATTLALAYLLMSTIAGEQSRSALYGAMTGVAALLTYRAFDLRAKGSVTRVLIVGAGQTATQAVDALHESDRHARVVGYYPVAHERDVVVPAASLIGRGRPLAEAVASTGATDVVVAVAERRGGNAYLADLLDCKARGVRVHDLSTHFERTKGQIRLDAVQAGWLIFGDGFNQHPFRTSVKRLFDLVSALALGIVALPIMVVTMLAIALDSKGPVFYRQQRVGLDGRPFDVIKFRSMYSDAEKDGQARWAAIGDDRITRVGRFIRKVRIDELPQIWNVLRGDMSIVGPRPERPVFVDQLKAELPYYALRHSVKPGITGWAQVRYHYGSTVEDALQKLQYDLYYVKNHTLFLDCIILIETAAVVLLGKGAR